MCSAVAKSENIVLMVEGKVLLVIVQVEFGGHKIHPCTSIVEDWIPGAGVTRCGNWRSMD